MDVLSGSRDVTSDAAPPRHHTQLGAAGWSRLGAPEAAPEAAATHAALKLPPLARVPADAARGLPALVVADSGQCTVDGQDEAPDAEQLFDHVIGHLDRLDAVLDERADALEARARHLEGLQADSFREQRRRITAAQEAGLSGALSRAADQTRRATEQLSAAMAEGMNSIILTAPAPIQQLARDVDRTMAPLADGARDLFGIKLTRLTSLKGRRAVYADELSSPDAGTSGGDNFVGLVGRGAERALVTEPADARFDDKNHETSVQRATGQLQLGSSAQGTQAGSAPGSPASARSRSERAASERGDGSAPASPGSSRSRRP